MICHKRKCIFVHIPKCGGTRIKRLLWQRPEDRTEENLWMGFVDEYHNKYQTGGLQHLKARQIFIEVGAEIFQSYFKFSIVRNPWDKAVSQYSYMKNRPDLQRFIGMKRTDDFKRYLELTTRKRHVQWEPQYKFLYDDDGKLLVDFVGRFESYEEDVPYLLSRLDLPKTPLLHEKKGQRSDYREYYDAATEIMIATLYRDDIELFGYAFDH